MLKKTRIFFLSNEVCIDQSGSGSDRVDVELILYTKHTSLFNKPNTNIEIQRYQYIHQKGISKQNIDKLVNHN